MPELPEVESVRRGVESYVVGKEITAVDIAHPRANRGQDEPLAGLVVGKEIAAVARRGKFMWLEFVGEDPMDSHRDVLFIHLGMSGQLRIGPTDSPHRRITVGLSDGTELHFVDQRTFGYWLYAPWSTISHIGLDPLEPDFDIASAARRLRKKKTAVKTALLDQTLVSGIGNIYADEALWAARISPRKKASALRQKDAVALLSAAQTVMSAALKAGGTSFDSLYVNVNGESGYFARSLAAYGRAGQPCSRCGSLIARSVIGGRSSHYCPHCQ